MYATLTRFSLGDILLRSPAFLLLLRYWITRRSALYFLDRFRERARRARLFFFLIKPSDQRGLRLNDARDALSVYVVGKKKEKWVFGKFRYFKFAGSKKSVLRGEGQS